MFGTEKLLLAPANEKFIQKMVVVEVIIFETATAKHLITTTCTYLLGASAH